MSTGSCCLCFPWLEGTGPCSPQVHAELPSRRPDQQAQVYCGSFLSKGYSEEKEVYREPGCELIAHLLVLTSGMATRDDV